MKKQNDRNIFSLFMVQKVIDYVEENLLEELSPATIASHFYISESTLCSVFKLACEMTVMEYIRNRRLTLAAEELATSALSIMELALKYSYETPEAFTKAFSRVQGFPPSFIRRGFSVTKAFLPLQLTVTVQGGWEENELTKVNGIRQEFFSPVAYNTSGNSKGGNQMEKQEVKYRIDTTTMQYQQEWRILCTLAEQLKQSRIPFKVDGKTMIFAHGLEFLPDKICLTFKWADEEKVRKFFPCDTETIAVNEGFKFLDVMYMEMKIRCMFYGNCPGDDTDEFLYKNADMVQMDETYVPVQSLKFYYENAEKDSKYYKMVEAWLEQHERL